MYRAHEGACGPGHAASNVRGALLAANARQQQRRPYSSRGTTEDTDEGRESEGLTSTEDELDNESKEDLEEGDEELEEDSEDPSTGVDTAGTSWYAGLCIHALRCISERLLRRNGD